MPSIAPFPDSVPLELDHLVLVQPFLLAHREGISELSMASLLPFTAKHRYRVFTYANQNGKLQYGFIGWQATATGEDCYAFFPAGYPSHAVMQQLIPMVDEINTIGTAALPSWSEGLKQAGLSLAIEEDRDNADYLYDRTSLVELVGQALHKKLAHAMKFAEDNPDRILLPARLCEDKDMLEVLYGWAAGKDNPEDMLATETAIRYRTELNLEGAVLYSKDTPVAFTLGEQDGPQRFIIHIEKALPSLRGAYQYINRAFAASLPESVVEVNREQDLGIPGLRQAKLTYKPSGFVMKHRIRIKT